jgi:serine/threonine protein kinase
MDRPDGSDIKPENLLFDRIPIIPSRSPISRQYDEEKEDEGEFRPGIGGGGIGRVKIADFGLSKIVWDEQTMTPCGTVGYTAPEIVKDERYSKSVDMWALGCVLYTLLCGFPPFYDESINVLTEKVARGYYTFLSPWWDDISHSAKDLITHLLCVDPAQRYTIDEFLAHPWIKVSPHLGCADVRWHLLHLLLVPKPTWRHRTCLWIRLCSHLFVLATVRVVLPVFLHSRRLSMSPTPSIGWKRKVLVVVHTMDRAVPGLVVSFRG